MEKRHVVQACDQPMAKTCVMVDAEARDACTAQAPILVGYDCQALMRFFPFAVSVFVVRTTHRIYKPFLEMTGLG